MKITKLGHCCLLIETKGKRILTDPGSYTALEHVKLTYIDYILFTHEHQDHFHVESLRDILKINPQATIYNNNSVGELLSKENIRHTNIKNGEVIFLGSVSVVGIGEKHAMMHNSMPLSENIGFFIDGRLWYPGDAFTNPERAVEILALPVSGPWMKISEAIDYAFLVKPKVAFPVHDGTRFGTSNALPAKLLPSQEIQFIVMKEGDSMDF